MLMVIGDSICGSRTRLACEVALEGRVGWVTAHAHVGVGQRSCNDADALVNRGVDSVAGRGS